MNTTNSFTNTPTTKCDRVKIGIDVHAAFAVVSRQLDGSKPQPPQKIPSANLGAWMRDQLQVGREVITCYEAGPTGFWLHRQLTALGVINYVVCPTALDSRGKGVNTDQTDAAELQSRLDRYLAGNNRAMSVVTVPELEQEKRRDLSRQRIQLRKHRLSLSAQGRTLMLKHGFHQSNSWWKPTIWTWLQTQLPDWIISMLRTFREVIETLEEKIKELKRQIVGSAPRELPRGLGALTYEEIDREVFRWDRFKNRRQAGSYAGLTGGVSSSGQQRADLSITKAGNKRLRTALVEAAWRLVRNQPDYWLVKKWRSVLGNPKAHARRRKQAIVAFARQFFVDLWKWKTGKVTAQSLGWIMTTQDTPKR